MVTHAPKSSPAAGEQSRVPVLSLDHVPHESLVQGAATTAQSWSSARTYEQKARRESERKPGFHSGD